MLHEQYTGFIYGEEVKIFCIRLEHNFVTMFCSQTSENKIKRSTEFLHLLIFLHDNKQNEHKNYISVRGNS